MKRKFSIIAVLIIMITSGALIFPGITAPDDAGSNKAELYTVTNRVKGAETYKDEIQYFADWNYPYGQNIPPDVYNRMWNDVKSVPSENEIDAPVVDNWRVLGPYGMKDDQSSAKYTGRILDVEVDNTSSIRVATATGGLWGYWGLFPLPLSDDLNTLAIGSFDTHPNDNNIILAGTGEYYTGSPSYQKVGTGLWRTSNGGNTWGQVTMSPTPQGFSRIRYSRQNPNIVHAVTVDGYYRSTNGGSNWSRVLTNSFCFDLAIDPSNNNYIYVTYNGGMKRSTNAGASFFNIGTNGSGFPQSEVGRISITVCQANPTTLYTGVELDSNDAMLGVFKSTNFGANWTNVSPDSNVLGGQGNYDNVIAACPTNSNIVLFGGIRMWRTTDGGLNWVRNLSPEIHADQHAIVWKNGNEVYAGNDGGLCYSTNAGLNWVSNTNIFPVTQFVNLSVGDDNTNIIAGGSRDNGMCVTTNGGLTWTQTLAGDGSGVAIDPLNANRIFMTSGVYNGAFAWKRFTSTNYGMNWTEVTDPVFDPARTGYTKMRCDRNVPARFYTNLGPHIYRTSNNGASWSKLNAAAFPDSSILNFSVSQNGGLVYVCLNATPPVAGTKLRVFDNGVWQERSSGLPSGQNVRMVGVHPYNVNDVYAVMNGVGTPTQKIYKSTNQGITWANITGNIPDVPLSDIVVHPSNPNKLFLGTQLGCYRSTNGGVNWHRWNNGMPDATVITELSYIDSANAGKFYIVAATYGRGIIIREASGDDPNGIQPISGNIPTAFSLDQNYPNPFNPVTNIKFGIPKAGNVKIVIYDISGREVTRLVDRELKAGYYNADFNAANLASGVYFYRLESKDFTDVKKMVLVK
ncbi:MAG TPA: T9SS type A sorting domain-containing protein [Ignavibacteria bacterium]|nr:T9SS type A sorting domain-containing protein [Ignavibacteria bacterium]HMQ98363.1 T9SS type A sorting domain-containing protein [Ignavibacteria bacterium]